MPTALLAALEPSLSQPRLKKYRQGTSIAPEDILARYLWNIDLAEALYPCLNAYEIALRNNVSRQLIQDFGIAWYQQQAFLDMLHYRTRRQLDRALKELNQDNERRVKRRQPPKAITSDVLIAELTLGFWTSLFWRHYDEGYWFDAGRLKNVFPGSRNKERKVRNLRRKITAVHALRNRAFHHEPIFKEPRLLEIHRDARALTSWLNPKVDGVLETLDHFPATAARPIGHYEALVKTIAAAP